MTSRRGIRACVGVATILAASLWSFVPAVPASAVTPSITVTPTTDLVDGQTVTVVGSGWAAGDSVYYCEAVSRATTPGAGDCDAFGAQVDGHPPLVTADETGHFSVSVTLNHVIYPFGGGQPLDCAGPTTQCVIRVGHGETSDHVDVSLHFAPVLPFIRVDDGSTTEGNSGTHDVTWSIVLSYASTSTVTVDWTTAVVADGGVSQADPATDYTAASGTVTFAPGETVEWVTISVNGDTLVERTEIIWATIGNVTNAVNNSGDEVAIGIINNDDHAVVLAGHAAVPEGNSGTTVLHLPVTLANASYQTITVQWFTGPAGPGPRADPANDFVAASGTVTFAPGETAKTVPITIIGDTRVEPHEWITVSFNHPTNATMGGFWGLGFGIIQKDD